MADLLRRVAERADPAAFRELYQSIWTAREGLMMRQGADAATAEDLAQETLFTVWRRASLYAADKGSAATWIFAIARNLRIDRLAPRDALAGAARGARRSSLARSLCPTRPLSPRKSGRRGCGPRSPRCPPEQHEVVVLSYLEGLSHGEIAARLGCRSAPSSRACASPIRASAPGSRICK